MTPETNRLLFVSGVTIGGYVVVALMTAATAAFLRNPQAWRRIGLRAIGSWITTIGIMLMGLRLFTR
jgi:urease accessory protein